MQYDLKITGGSIIDGTGKERFITSPVTTSATSTGTSPPG